jgi:hypothetical protein
MLSRIQKAFQSQERFIADASHQLLTPLTILRQELELFRKNPNQDSESFIKSSIQEVDILSKVIQEMLLLARADAGLGALNLQELSLEDLVFEALTRCEKLATSKSIKLKFNINNETSEDRKMILGDNDLLGNLVFNIVENAIKYSPNNEVVSIRVTHREKTCELIVDDNGPGIPQEQLPFIFERFSRGANMGSQIKGFGLGLAIAQKIAILHGAKLSAENHTGNGARLTFEIKNI